MKIKFIALIKLVGLGVLVTVLVCVGQLLQLQNSVNDIRYAAIEEWKEENPGKTDVADLYIKDCIENEKTIKEMAMSSEGSSALPLSQIECSIDTGAKDLFHYINSRTRPLKSTAFPLSLL